MTDRSVDPLDSVQRLVERLTELESRYTHLQRVLEECNEVIVEQGRQIDQLQRRVGLFTRQLEALAEQGVEPRSLEEDKPPHY